MKFIYIQHSTKEFKTEVTLKVNESYWISFDRESLAKLSSNENKKSTIEKSIKKLRYQVVDYTFVQF